MQLECDINRLRTSQLRDLRLAFTGFLQLLGQLTRAPDVDLATFEGGSRSQRGHFA